jgi:hypothetical protein
LRHPLYEPRWKRGVYGIIHGAVGRDAAFSSLRKGRPESFILLGLLRVQVLLEGDAELLAQGLELGQVLLVLALVLDLGLDACF